MAEYSISEMKALLEQHPEYREKLYCRGFLLTNSLEIDCTTYPFYNNCNETVLSGDYRLFVHKDTTAWFHTDGEISLFLVGHAYDPFAMLSEESVILRKLAAAIRIGEEAFWEAESDLTGIFILGYVREGRIVYTTDCTGMQLVYHGVIGNSLCVTSHSKLAADLWGMKRDPYIDRLVRSRFYRYFGTVLPGDRSPYLELIRLQSNHAGYYEVGQQAPVAKRYYPTRDIRVADTEDAYKQIICELGDILSRSMTLISKKWEGKKVAISVTGGNDSKTTLACANGSYEHFGYFSYISDDAESVDAYAAQEICRQLKLPHVIHEIHREDAVFADIEVFRKILECNAGCIGKNNTNDVRKRLALCHDRSFDIEVKSWVNEIGRARYHKRYNKVKFPEKLTASYCRTLYKIIFSPRLIHDTDKVFREYLDRYYFGDVFDKIPWTDLYYWEYVWGSGEGLFLTAEHKVSYDITIPFNNRRYLEKMLTTPLRKRIDDCIPRDIIADRNRQLAECGISVKDVGYTDSRTVLERGYLEIFSRLAF